MYIALQRCTTAREAIHLIAELANEYGYASSGESISIADKEEAWILEIIAKRPEYNEAGENTNKGVVWVAARIPDGYISAHANAARITAIDPNDSENFMYAEDLFDYVREAGLYDGPAEQFSFADTFCPLDFSLLRGCEARVWAFFNAVNSEMAQYWDYAKGKIEHEATVSKVSDDQLFYLMSRGLTEQEATEMIVMGFIEPFAKELPMEYAVELNQLIKLEMKNSIG